MGVQMGGSSGGSQRCRLVDDHGQAVSRQICIAPVAGQRMTERDGAYRVAHVSRLFLQL